MPRKKKAPELTFQQHIADYLARVALARRSLGTTPDIIFSKSFDK
jgi:hypothetical protein